MTENRASARLLGRDFLILWQGQLVSQVGSQAYIVAMTYWTLDATGSATVMGLLMLAATLPAVVLGPVAGAIADGRSRKAIIVGADTVRGFMMLLLAWGASSYSDRTTLLVALLIVVAVVHGVVGAVFNPAVGSSIPDLVTPDRVAGANSLMQLSTQGAMVLGQAAGGVAYRLVGAPALFVIDGVSFLFSGASETLIRIPVRSRPNRDSAEGPHGILRDARAGLRFVWDDAGLRTFILTTAALNLLFMPVFVLLPFYSRDILRGSAALYGFLLAGLSAGTMAGVAAAGVLRMTGRHRRVLLTIAFLMVPAGMLALAFSTSPRMALGILVCTGAMTGAINVFVMTLLQLVSPPEMRARVLAIAICLAQAAMPLGMAAGGIAGDLTGMALSWIFATCGVAALIAVFAGLRRPALRTLLAVESFHVTAA